MIERGEKSDSSLVKTLVVDSIINILSFSLSLNRYLSNAHCVPGTVAGTEDTMRNETDKVFALTELLL